MSSNNNVNRVRLMSDTDAALLQDAGEQVADLTLQGYHPTDAVAKVASALKLPKRKTDLLIYAYNNGVSAEKRASAGGPFERLQEFPMPDPVKVHELVYGESSKEPVVSDSLLEQKTASFDSLCDIFPKGMATFDTDISGLSQEEISTVLGLTSLSANPSIKTASEDSDSGEKNKNSGGRGFSISQTTVRIGLCPMDENDEKEKDARFVHKIPETIKEQIDAGFKMMSPALNRDIDSSLLKLMGLKEAAMHKANADAENAYVSISDLLDGMTRNIGARHLSPSFKAAGLVSVNAYYPEIAEILSTRVGEVDAHLIKHASYSPLDVNANHPWVTDAKRLYAVMEKTAELTVAANKCTEEYKITRDLYFNRPKYKAADWRVFVTDNGESEQQPKTAGIADILGGTHIVGQAGEFGKGFIAPTKASDDRAAKIKADALEDLEDPVHEINLRNIEIQNMINDFSANDEILSAFPIKDLLRGYSDLLHTAPTTMRNRAQARALLQQYMTQGRMAPTELIPALQMNKLTKGRSSETGDDSLGTKV